ncbi:hypothetical protein SVIO_048710 [Streptomyces violaceusniger]|uniref:Uncharacterized protein n=1 Tax=Streptomyces violaceusniger TaxID=68280 RepID=A0A4D4L6S9_STRVO|nr:hypothetical protein SVIO_048710 [Streptomyces violaceusniger]
MEQQIALVLGEQIDIALLEGGYDDLSGAEVGPHAGLDARALQRLGVEVAQQLVLGEVGGADDQPAQAAAAARAAAAAVALERGDAAATGGERGHGGAGEQAAEQFPAVHGVVSSDRSEVAESEGR